MKDLKLAAYRRLRALVRFPGKEAASSFGVTLPKEAIRALGWNEGDLLQIWYPEKGDFLIIRRAAPKDQPHAPPR